MRERQVVGIGAVVAVEARKLWRAPVAWGATGLAIVVIPLLSFAFLRLAGSDVDGATAAKLDGMVVGEGWAALLGVVGQLVAVGHYLAVGFVTTWCFGREFSDGTVSALFALPVPRGRVAVGKSIVLAGWALGLSTALVVVVGVIGALAGLADGGASVGTGLARVWVLALLTAMLALPLGLAASVGRGYLAGMGALIAVVAVSQVMVLFGVGGWFPFAAPGLWAVGWQVPEVAVTPIQLALVPVVAVVGVAATAAWWNRFQVR